MTTPDISDIDTIRKEYTDSLVRNLKDHTIRGFSPRVSSSILTLPLAKIFLPLQAVEGRPPLSEYAEQDLLHQAASASIHESELDWQRRRDELEKRYAQLAARQTALRSISLSNLLKHPAVVILGDPGSGKSTIARYVAYALAADDMTHLCKEVRGRVPVLVRIASYAATLEQDKSLTLLRYIAQKLVDNSAIGQFLQRSIERGQCLVILDGLDEVSDNLRCTITEHIQSMVAHYSDNSYIVTSRIVGYDVSPMTRDFKHATLQELTEQDRERFVHLWYDAITAEITDSCLPHNSGELIQAFREKPQIARMAANPLLLTIMVLMHWRGTTLPNRRVQVYDIATDTLIQYWTSQRRVKMEAEDVKLILSPIAYHILSGSVSGVISHHDLLPLFKQGIQEQRGCTDCEARTIRQQMLRDLNEESGLFLERGRDADNQPVYGFLHQTFGEYLAGLHMAQMVLNNEFELAKYIHRSVWYESFLLMVGDLSIRSRKHVDTLIRQILDFPAPYEETLQRNTLLTADCLADDVQLHNQQLRNEVLDKLAALLAHDAPQVREEAVIRYQRLRVTRHRAAALDALHRKYPLQNLEALTEWYEDIWLGLVTALLHLGEHDLAQPILWYLDEKMRTDFTVRKKVQQLRFEHWPEQAADYLLKLLTDKNHIYPFPITTETLGPVGLELAQRVLGNTALLQLIEKLMQDDEFTDAFATLRWLQASLSESSQVDAFVSIMNKEISPSIRSRAATRLLESDYRAEAVAVLRKIVLNEWGVAPEAAQFLYEAGEAQEIDWSLLYDMALLNDDNYSGSTIAILLQAGEVAIALPAALHLLVAMPHLYNRDRIIWEVTQRLLGAEHCAEAYAVGLATARWLALRPGFAYRLDSCEALIKSGQVEQTIPPLMLLAYECYDESSQKACMWLLKLGESAKVVPLLAHATRSPDPSLRYQACTALALAGYVSDDQDGISNPRAQIDLKMTIASEHAELYRTAQDALCRAGRASLVAHKTSDMRASAAQNLAHLALTWLGDRESANAMITELLDTPYPVVRLQAARFALRAGHVSPAYRCLYQLLDKSVSSQMSSLVRQHVVGMLALIADRATVSLFCNLLSDEECPVRLSAAGALGRLGDAASVTPLIAALSDEECPVRLSAAGALGRLGDAAAVTPLIAALSDEDGDVRFIAADALGRLGDAAAVTPLIAALSDEDSSIRYRAAEALGQLGDVTAVTPLIAALSDANAIVRQNAADALGQLGDVTAVAPLIAALSDNEEHVRNRAVVALGLLGDVAVEPLIAALSNAYENVRSGAAFALGRLGNAIAVEPLIAVLVGAEEGAYVWSVASVALARLGDKAAVAPLISVLSDTNKDGAVRCRMAYTLGMLPDTTAVAPLMTALSDTDEDIRSMVAMTLGNLGDSAAVAPLIAALSDTEATVRSSAARSLGRLDDVTAVKPLITALSDEDEDVWNDAIVALGRLGDATAVEPLMTMLSHADMHTRCNAAEALGRLRDATAVVSLIVALADADDDVRQNAAEALGRLGDAAAVMPLIVALADANDDVRRNAAEALGRLGDAAAVMPLIAALLDDDSDGRRSVALALARLNALDAVPLLNALSKAEFMLHGISALIHLDLDIALQALERAVPAQRKESWFHRLRGYAQMKQNDMAGACTSMRVAVEVENENDSDNLLALTHAYLEFGDFQCAHDTVAQALAKAVDDYDYALGLLCHAVVLWSMDKQADAMESLHQAIKWERLITNASDLRYEHFWGPRALATLDAMLAERAC